MHKRNQAKEKLLWALFTHQKAQTIEWRKLFPFVHLIWKHKASGSLLLYSNIQQPSFSNLNIDLPVVLRGNALTA